MEQDQEQKSRPESTYKINTKINTKTNTKIKIPPPPFRKPTSAKLSQMRPRARKAKAAEAKLMSISIAMFMAVVAMLGAVTAYRAALAEQDTLARKKVAAGGNAGTGAAAGIAQQTEQPYPL